MEFVVLILRFILSAVFLTAAVAKILDLKGSKKSVEDFGVPASVSLVSLVILIFSESAIALFLFYIESSRLAATAAFLLLGVFVVAMSRLLSKGEAPDCHCFGQLDKQPVGKSGLIRNGGLMVIAALVITLPQRGYDITGSLGRGTILVYFLFGALVTVLLSVLASKERSQRLNAAIRERSDTAERLGESIGAPSKGLLVGSSAPEIHLQDFSGRKFRIHRDEKDALPVLLIFVGPECVPCGSLAEDFDRWRKELEGKVRLVLVSSGNEDENLERFGRSNSSLIYLQENNDAADSFGIKWTPSAVFVSGDGRIQSRSASGDSVIRKLVSHVKDASITDGPILISEPGEKGNGFFGLSIPDFNLKKPGGGTASRDLFIGNKTLAVSWSLTCHFCGEIIDELRLWQSGVNGLSLSVFADGERDELLKSGLENVLIFDPEFAVSKLLGMPGTPSAVIIDENGIIISETGIGPDGIRSLVGSLKETIGK